MTGVGLIVALVSVFVCYWQACRAREAAQAARSEARRWRAAAAQWEFAYYRAHGELTPRRFGHGGDQ